MVWRLAVEEQEHFGEPEADQAQRFSVLRDPASQLVLSVWHAALSQGYLMPHRPATPDTPP